MKDRLTQFWNDYRNDAFIAALVALFVFGAFGLVRATAPMPEKGPLTIEPLPIAAQLSNEIETTEALVASKNGTKYYLTTCNGANRIKEENKIYFTSVQEAQENGYEPAANCPGL